VIAGLFGLSTFSYAAFSTMANTFPADLFPSESVATVSGMSGTGAGIGTILSTVLIGYTSDRYSFDRSYRGEPGASAAMALVLLLIRNTAESGHGRVRIISFLIQLALLSGDPTIRNPISGARILERVRLAQQHGTASPFAIGAVSSLMRAFPIPGSRSKTPRLPCADGFRRSSGRHDQMIHVGPVAEEDLRLQRTAYCNRALAAMHRRSRTQQRLVSSSA